jgi:hypothetical protein
MISNLPQMWILLFTACLICVIFCVSKSIMFLCLLTSYASSREHDYILTPTVYCCSLSSRSSSKHIGKGNSTDDLKHRRCTQLVRTQVSVVHTCKPSMSLFCYTKIDAAEPNHYLAAAVVQSTNIACEYFDKTGVGEISALL